MKNEKEILDRGRKKTVKLRGRGENNLSVISGAKAEDISRCMANCMMFYDRPIVKSDEECKKVV